MKKHIRVTFTKYFTAGILKGIAVEESMPFTDWTRAVAWAGSVTRSESTNYIVTEMTGPHGESETF